MKSSIYGTNRGGSAPAAPLSHQQMEIQEQIRQENEALLDALSSSVSRMKSSAGSLGREVHEQNEILQTLGRAFSTAQNGVGASVTQLRTVLDRYGWKHTLYVSLGVMFGIWILKKRREATPDSSSFHTKIAACICSSLVIYVFAVLCPIQTLSPFSPCLSNSSSPTQFPAHHHHTLLCLPLASFGAAGPHWLATRRQGGGAAPTGQPLGGSEDPFFMDPDFDFQFLDELCDEISGDLGKFIPDGDFSLLSRETPLQKEP
eukprot:gene3711-2611_t